MGDAASSGLSRAGATETLLLFGVSLLAPRRLRCCPAHVLPSHRLHKGNHLRDRISEQRPFPVPRRMDGAAWGRMDGAAWVMLIGSITISIT